MAKKKKQDELFIRVNVNWNMDLKCHEVSVPPRKPGGESQRVAYYENRTWRYLSEYGYNVNKPRWPQYLSLFYDESPDGPKIQMDPVTSKVKWPKEKTYTYESP